MPWNVNETATKRSWIRQPRSATKLALAATLLAFGCGSVDAASPTFSAEADIAPSVAALPSIDGTEPRPLAVIEEPPLGTLTTGTR